MDASLTLPPDLTYSDTSPVLVAATSKAAAARARATICATGLRIGGELPVDEVSDRLDRQVATSALWVEIDEDGGGPMDELLLRVSRDVSDGRYAAVISSTGDMIDPVTSVRSDSSVEIVVDGSESERLAAFAVATARAGMPPRLSDVSADRSAERLRQLSDEVGRIASTLARLSAGPAPAPAIAVPIHAGESEAISADVVRSVIRARRLRARFFSEEMFADPAWDMLLDLLQAEISHLRVPVSSLCIAAAVPATTALRWLKTMVAQGLFIRRADPHDGRRVFVELAPETSNALRRYFAEVGTVAVI